MRKLLLICLLALTFSNIQSQTKTISKEDYHDKTLAMLIGMCGGFLSGYEYLNQYNTPDGYWAPDATMYEPKTPLLGLPDDWFVYMGGTCGGTDRDEHPYGSWQLPNGDMNSDDDSHIDIFNQYILNRFGPSVSYQEIKEMWMYHKVSDYGGGQGAIEVMRDKDLLAPQCGQRDHGNSGYWLPEGYIEAETMGAAFPGMMFKAAEMTEYFMHVVSEGQTTEWGKYWAAAHAQAYFETDARVAMEKALGTMPGNSRIRQTYDICVALHAKHPNDWRAAVREWWYMPMYGPMSVGFGGVQMLGDSNNGTGILSILYGENDYDKTLRIVSLAGGDGDCTGSSVCGVLGIIHGMIGTPQPFKDRLYRDGEGRWINDVVHAFAIKYDFPLSFTFEELTNMYQQNAEAMIRAYGGSVSETTYTVPYEEGEIPQIATQNWSFEDGDLTGWNVWKSGSATAWAERQCNGDNACAAAQGQYKGTIMTEGDDSEAKLYQTVTGLTPGATYRIEGRLHCSGGRETRLYAENFGGEYTYASMRNGNNPYRYTYLYVTLGESATSMDFGLHAPPTTNPGKWCNIDNVIVTQVTDPAIPVRFEAEDAVVNNVDINENPSASGGKYIGGMFKEDSYVEFPDLFADYTGEYILRVNFANAGAYAQQKVTVNGQDVGLFEYNETGDWRQFSGNVTDIHLNLKKGKNSVRLSFHSEAIEIDYVDFFSPNGAAGKIPDDGNIVDGGIYIIKSRKSGKVLDVEGTIGNGANILQRAYTGAASQQFKLQKSDGTYTITTLTGNQAVEVGGWGTDNGDNVNLYTNTTAGCQKWAIVDTDTKYVKLLNQNSGLALDVAGASTAEDANIFQWEYLGGDNQQWELIYVGTDEGRTMASLPGRIEAESFTNQLGLGTKESPNPEGGDIIAFIDNNDFTEYPVYVSEDGNYTFSFHYAPNSDGGSVNIMCDNLSAGTAQLDATGGWNTWRDTAAEIALTEGFHTLRFDYQGTTALFDIDWVDVSATVDCHGDINGTASLDECGVCSGGNTGIDPCAVQTLSLVEGWNLVSLNIQLEDSTIASVFPNAKIVKTMSGSWHNHYPAYLNQFNSFETGKGYMVYNGAIEEIYLTGAAADIVPAQLKSGWNLIATGSDQSVTDYFGLDIEKILSVKDFQSFWLPDGNTTLSELESGKAYFVELE